MWLDGTPIAPATVYSVTVNSFLASGGDGFLELNNGAGEAGHRQDRPRGVMVDYMAALRGLGPTRSRLTTVRTVSGSPSQPVPQLPTRRAPT